MPIWRLRIEQRAENEARSAFLWYLARNARAAEQFEAAVGECIDAIVEAPERWPEIHPGVRRRLVFHRFPYGVLYRIVGDEIQVVAVMHLHRRPGDFS
jgi:plasmid stabilization system protein ParE